MDVKGDIGKRDELSLALCRQLADDFEVFDGMEISEEGETRYHWLEEQMTFMYR